MDTSAGKWKDAGDGAGIVPKSLPDGVEQLNAPERIIIARKNDLNEGASSKDLGDHYVGDVGGKNRWSKFFKNHFTIPAIMNKVLRKTTEKNTWMYISVCFFVSVDIRCSSLLFEGSKLWVSYNKAPQQES